MKIAVSTVIKMQSGIVESVRAFTSEEEAVAEFKELVLEANNGHDNITDDIMQNYIDTGDYELDNGINIVLAHSEGDETVHSGTVGGAVKHLIGYDSDAPMAYALWVAEDVKTRAEELDIEGELTDDEISAVLYDVHRHQDCSYGISWDSIDDAILDVVRDRD